MEDVTARCVVDEQGRVTEWSAGAERLLGYPPAELVGRSAAMLLAEEIATEDLLARTRLPHWTGHVLLRHRNGHHLRASVMAHHRTPDHGSADWLLLSALTRPRPEDDALVQRAFAQSPCCAMSAYDADLRHRRSNESGQSAMGISNEAVFGLRPTEAAPGPLREEIEQHMLRALETGELQRLEARERAPGETRERNWLIHSFRVEDTDGRVLGVAITGQDTTEQHWARKRLAVIADAGRRIGTTLDVTRTAEELTEVVVPELADFVSVDLLASLDNVDEPHPGALAARGAIALRRVAHRSVYPDAPEAAVALGEADHYPEGTPPVESLRSGRALLRPVTDPSVVRWIASDPVRAARIREFGMHSAMTVPLSARGTTLGVVVFVRHRYPDPFEQDDLVLAEELAARAAVCIDNARRYTRERDTAVTLQRSLLPRRLPEQTAVEFAHRYLPASAEAGVGGDWFDVIPLSAARVALVVGDVVGHGLHASATMGRLRAAVRTLADIDLPPDELLTHLDDLVARLATEAEGTERAGGASVSADIGTTCLYAVYDPVSRRCSLARAGHPLPAVVSPDGSVRPLDIPAGPPLGLGGLPFEATDVELPEGSLLALYTDGLISSREHDMEAGVTLFHGALTRPAASLEALCDTVLTELLPQRPTDDVALLIARTRALSAEQVATWTVTAEPVAVAQTRKDAVAQLEAWGLDDVVFVTELIVSELVTNAIRHAEPPIELRLIRAAGNLICEVSDSSSTAPHMRRARTYDEGGRGLLLVSQLTQRWGTRQTTAGKKIWAEQTLPTLAQD